MYSYSTKRKREDELLAVPRTSGHQGMNFRTSPIISGSYSEVEPLHKRLDPSTVGSGFRSGGATRMPDRVSLYETNRLLSDDQIQRFISSTVLPHHRTLTNSDLVTNSNGRTLTNNKNHTLASSNGVSWSKAPPGSRPAPPTFQKQIKTGNYAYQNLVEDLPRRQSPQGLISVPQDTQRGSQGNRAYFHRQAQGTTTRIPHKFSFPQRRQEFLISQETHGKAFSIPHSTITQAVSFHQVDISNHNKVREGISTFPQGIQEKVISFPKGSPEQISRVPVLTTEENDILQELFFNQEGRREIVDFPKGTQSLSHEPSGLEEAEDDIIIVHQGTPEDLISIVQETLQEIMGVPEGNSVSQETAEEVIGIPNQITVYDETGKEITGFSARTVDEIMGITQEIAIPQGSVEEIMGIPKGTPVPQETLQKIMDIMATVPDETLQEIMGFPQGIDFPQGTQGQAFSVQNQNRCEGNSGVHRHDQQSFWKSHSETAPTSNVTVQHQLSPSYNQSMQTVTPQTFPVQEKPKQNHLPGGTTQGRASDPDPLLVSLSVSTNASWGGNSGLQRGNENSLVKDTMIHDNELNGNCRKRRREDSSDTMSRKRQRGDETTNLDTGNKHRDAGLMVMPERSQENEEFFASKDKCLKLSSEKWTSNEKYAFLEDLDNVSLETFPSEVIDDIYVSTFESDRFLDSDDDFVTDSLAFLKEGGEFGLCGLW